MAPQLSCCQRVYVIAVMQGQKLFRRCEGLKQPSALDIGHNPVSGAVQHEDRPGDPGCEVK